MAASIGTAWIQIKPSMAGVGKDIGNQLGVASSVGGKAMSNQLSGIFDGLGKNISSTFTNAFKQVTSTARTLFTAGVGGAIALLGSKISSAFKRIDTLKNANRMFEAMGYATEDVNRNMDDLNKYLIGLPTSLDEGVRGVTALSQAFGGIDLGTKAFKAMNNAGLAFGSTNEQISNAITQLGQLSLDGPLDAATWNSLRNSGFGPVFAAMARESKVSVGQLKADFGGHGTKSVQEFLDRLLKMDKEGSGSMKSLREMARTNTDGIVTSFTNMGTAITRGVGYIIESIPGLTGSIQGVGKAIEGVLKGELSPQQGAELINEFIGNVVKGLSQVLKTMVPLVLESLTALVTAVADSVKDLLADRKSTTKLIEGFVRLFVAIGTAASEIAQALIPYIPVIIAEIAKEFAKPENAKSLITGMGILLSYAIGKTVAGNVVKKATAKFAEVGTQAASDFAAGFAESKAAESAFTGLAGTMGGVLKSAMVGIGTAAKVMWAAITGPVGLAILAIIALVAIFWYLWNHVDGFREFMLEVWETIKNAVKGAIDWVKNNWPLLLAILTGPIGIAVLAITRNFDKIKSAAQTVWNFIKGMWDYIRSVPGKIIDAFKSIGSAIGNGIKNGLNSLLRLPLRVPSISIAGKTFGGQTLIPRLAEGGIVTGPTLALIGEGRESEAVIPLSKLDKMMGGSGRPIHIENVNIASDYDATRLLEILGIKQDLYSKGVVSG